MAKTVYDVLVDKYAEDVSASTEFLIAGSAKDYAEYREVVGRIRGLRLAIDATKDLSRSQLEDDDNE
jgi:hypothetical protein